jgi:hypothetical protein
MRQVLLSRQSPRHVKCRPTLNARNDMKTNPGIQAAPTMAAASVSAPPRARTANARGATSLRIPVTESNRSRLRTLRANEAASWERKPKLGLEASARAARATLRTQVAHITQQRRQETLLYGTVACFSTLAVGYALWDSFRLFESWPAFVQFVQRLIG